VFILYLHVKSLDPVSLPLLLTDSAGPG